MAARKFQLGDQIGEYKDLGPSVMAMDCTGSTVLLASKRVLQFVDLKSPSYDISKVSRKNVKWEVNAAQWNPHYSDSTTFVVTRNQDADIFEYLNGRAEVKATLKSHTRSITDLDWCPSQSHLLLSCSSDSNSFVWDTRCYSTPSLLFETSQMCSASQVKWNKLEEHIFATSHDRDIRVWDTRKNDRPLCISGHLKRIHCLDWSPHHSKRLASASEDETVKFWDYTNSQYMSIGEVNTNTNSPVWKARFTPFEKCLLTIDVSLMRREGDKSLKLWNIEDLTNPIPLLSFVGHQDVVNEFQWRQVEPYYQLITWSRDHTLKKWSYETGHKGLEVGDNLSTSATSNSIIFKEAPNYLTKNNMNGHSYSPQNSIVGNNRTTTSLTYDDEDDDESSQDEHSSPVSPTRHGGHRRESKLLPADTSLFTLTEVRDDQTSEALPLPLSQLDGESLVRNDSASQFPDDIDDDDDDELLASPLSKQDTLQYEFQCLSDIKDVTVQLDSNQRKSLVSIAVVGGHKVKLIMSFPISYPDEMPKFQFDSSTSLERAVQTKLINDLCSTAKPLISQSKACVELCIKKLKSEIEELEPKLASIENDSFLKAGHSSSTLSFSTAKSIPYPRTCAAYFCNDRLITFQRPIHTPHPSTPRSLADVIGGHTPHSSRSRSIFSTPMSRSPKEAILPAYFKKLKTKQKKERPGRVTIYNVSLLLPFSKELAVKYELLPSPSSCRHNMEMAAAHDRRDMQQIWAMVLELLDEKLNPDGGDIFQVPIAHLPLGRAMLQSILDHYARLGDFQSASVLLCMFPYKPPKRVVRSPHDERYGGGSHLIQIQRSASKRIISTSPANSLSGRSPPDKHNSIDQMSTESLSNGWTTTTLRRKENSSHGSSQDIRGSSFPEEMETDMQRHKRNLSLLDSAQSAIFDYYKTQYADILYRWGLFSERAQLLATLSSYPDSEQSAIALLCSSCDRTCTGTRCGCSQHLALSCALCRRTVKGNSVVCYNCGHGGHNNHMKLWFQTEKVCATGCGCACLEYSVCE